MLTGTAILMLCKECAPNAVQVMEYCCGFADTAALEAHLDELKKEYSL